VAKNNAPQRLLLKHPLHLLLEHLPRLRLEHLRLLSAQKWQSEQPQLYVLAAAVVVDGYCLAVKISNQH
jgi:hypothetical protein